MVLSCLYLVITFSVVSHEKIISIVSVTVVMSISTNILIKLTRMPDFTVTRMESHEE